MKDHLKAYKERLEKGICEYMDMPVTERSASAVHAMLECLEEIEDWMRDDYGFTREDAAHWNQKMVNDDDTMGGHWTIDQTTSVAEAEGVKFEHVTPYCWNTAMNMMYSDYCSVADKHGVGTTGFYADMAKAFLFDKDGGPPKAKMAAYYHGIVDKE